MKTIAALSLVCLCVTAPILAVVPPSTSILADADSASPSSDEKVFDQRAHTPLERLEGDIRRLEGVLRDLQEDYRELKQSAEKKERLQ